EHNEKNQKSTTPHTPKIPTTRLLCECELYAPANYDNDQEMKAVMENFSKQTEERFHEYDERMKNTRQKCKDKCDKEIQKIILKDKLEKELTEKLSTLKTDIRSEAIPTCICEKSIADRMEKGCLRCGSVLGGGIAPTVGLLGGIGIYGWKMGVPEAAAKAAAIAAGKAAGEAAGLKAGMKSVIVALKYIKVDELFSEIYKPFVAKNIYTEVTKLAPDIVKKYGEFCPSSGTSGPATCIEFGSNIGMVGEGVFYDTPDVIIPKALNLYLSDAKKSAATEAARVTTSETATLTKANVDAVNTAYGSFQTAIIASIIAIVIIVLIMVIIYKILRYRRKRKMKKKLQYIKLLEE
ncbi:rifin, partial [Plasmodium reichenowi]